MSDKMYVITIEATDLGQIIEGLKCRSEAYHVTEEYYLTGNISDDQCIQEVKDEHEAAKIAAYYDKIIAGLEGQINHQDELAAKSTNGHLSNTEDN